MSAAPGTSRAERQAAQLASNQAQAQVAAKAGSIPGGGINQPQYRAQSGPTWSDSPAGRQLRIEYEKSGVVFDSGGNIIYNPADLGSSNVEAARAAQGLSPSYQTKGEPSGQYLSAVASAGGDIKKIQTKQAELEAVRGETTSSIASQKARLAEQKAELERQRSAVGDPGKQFHRQEDLMKAIQGTESYIADLQGRLSGIDQARMDVAKEQRAAQTYQTKAALAATRDKTTAGPVPVKNALAADYTQRIEEARPVPQRARVQAQTGVKEKLFANPDFMINAHEYTRPNLEAQQTRKERPKAQQGVEAKLLLNPNYVTKEQQKEKDTTKINKLVEPKTTTSYSLFLNDSLEMGEGGYVEHNKAPVQKQTVTPKPVLQNKEVLGPKLPPIYAEQKKIEKFTGLDLGFVSPITKGIDSTFETDKPIEQRSELNQRLAGIAAPFANIGGIIYDTGKAVAKEIKKPGSGFEFRGTDIATGGNPLNLPYAKTQTPTQETAFGDLLEGKIPDLSKPYQQGTIIGDIGLAAIGAKQLKSTGVKTKKIDIGTRPKEAPTIEPTNPTKFYRETNMMREKVPTDIFQRDTATQFAKEQVRLGSTTATGVVIKSKPPVITYEIKPTNELKIFNQGVKVKPVEEDPFYVPRPEMKRYKQVDYTETFGKDTASPGFIEQRIELGAGITKRIEPKSTFTSQEIGLGKSESGIRIQGVNLGTGLGQPVKGLPSNTYKSTYRQPVKEEVGFVPEKPKGDIFQRDVFSETSVKLGTGTTKTPNIKLDQGVKVKPVEEDPFYVPRPEMKRYKQVDYTETFGKDTKLGPFTEKKVLLGRGIVKKLGGKDKPTSSGKKPITPTDTEQTGKSGATVILEKPKDVKFKSEKIELGKGEATVITSSGTIASAPVPLLSKAMGDESIPSNTLANTTQTNQTNTTPISDESSDLSQSVLEPQSITRQRPELVPVVSQRGFAGVDNRLAERSRQRLGRVSITMAATKPALRSSVTTIPMFRQSQPQKQPQKEKQAQKQKTPFPNPMKQPLRLAQPEAFKQKELLKLKTPPPKPPKRLLFVLPPTKRKERKEKRKKEELKPNDFLGNASQENITTGYNRQEIYLGIKKTARIERKDLAKERRGLPRFINNSTNPILAKSKPNLIRPEKKRRLSL